MIENYIVQLTSAKERNIKLLIEFGKLKLSCNYQFEYSFIYELLAKVPDMYSHIAVVCVMF